MEHQTDSIKAEARLKIGNQVRQARKSAGLTTYELSEKCGIAQNHISRIEQGRYNVTIDTLSLIASALGASIEINKISPESI